MIGGSVPGRCWEFFSSPPCRDRLWGLPSLRVPGALSLEVEEPEREADHLPPSSAEVKNTPLWHGAQLKHRDFMFLPF
jgi:hypothetical protein